MRAIAHADEGRSILLVHTAGDLRHCQGPGLVVWERRVGRWGVGVGVFFRGVPEEAGVAFWHEFCAMHLWSLLAS